MARCLAAWTRPQAGSDAGDIADGRAAGEGDEWLVNGTKIFVTNGHYADAQGRATPRPIRRRRRAASRPSSPRRRGPASSSARGRRP
ncbi:MAG: acyl-CoA dehydrogenase family protein [Candidatus Eisenbacteria bacterium]